MGSDQSGICYERRTYLTKILDGTARDDTYFGIVYTLDPEDDWADEGNWIKANPNLDVSVYREELRPLAQKAVRMPSAMNNFLTKHMSIWVNSNVALFDMINWKEFACAQAQVRKPHDQIGRGHRLGVEAPGARQPRHHADDLHAFPARQAPAGRKRPGQGQGKRRQKAKEI